MLLGELPVLSLLPLPLLRVRLVLRLSKLDLDPEGLLLPIKLEGMLQAQMQGMPRALNLDMDP
jgi:hypothetical protein|nr:hypothetical protein Q903MT_gene745 [Picea sitchensis]